MGAGSPVVALCVTHAYNVDYFSLGLPGYAAAATLGGVLGLNLYWYQTLAMLCSRLYQRRDQLNEGGELVWHAPSYTPALQDLGALSLWMALSSVLGFGALIVLTRFEFSLITHHPDPITRWIADFTFWILPAGAVAACAGAGAAPQYQIFLIVRHWKREFAGYVSRDLRQVGTQLAAADSGALLAPREIKDRIDIHRAVLSSSPSPAGTFTTLLPYTVAIVAPLINFLLGHII